MLRPERMSKVSVTGSRQVVEPVVEAVHDLNLVHLTDYDGGWDGFDPGVSTEGAEAAADKLVTVRSLESILDVDDADAGERRVVSDEALEEDLTEAQTAVNEVADRRDEIRDELRDVRERMEALEPFVELGIDLDLLSGYDALDVAVGYGDSEDVRERLQRGPFDEFQLFTEDDVLAVFARPTDPTTALADELVGASFAAVEIPDVDEQTAPGTYLAELSNRREELDAELDRIETEFDRLRGEWGSFLLAAEEELSIRVAKAEAPLSFATTEHAFVAEGWVPTEQYTELDAAITEAVGDRAEVEELQRATFGHGGEVELREDVPPAVREAGTEPADEEETEREPPRAAADGGSEDDRAVTDGGTAASPVVMRDDEPPTVQDNPGPAGPFELLTRLVGTPSYSELDPTIILTLTFPLMFGFMVGDVGYGLIYTGIGFWIASRFDSDTFQSMATITVVAGLATTVFGVLYGEVFGTHLVSTVLWEGALGLKHPPIEKGLSPATREWAETWFVVSVLFGVVHLNVGYVFEFVENLQLHGIVEALEETGSWILVINGLYLFVFSTFPGGRQTPEILFTVFDGKEAAIDLGFTGLPEVVGIAGIVMMAVGFVLLGLGPTYELIEFIKPLSHSLSYLRLGAVLVAKAGLAFAVNLLVFGVYTTSESPEEAVEWHFGLPGFFPEAHGMPAQSAVGTEFHGEVVREILFGGLIHGDILATLVGIVVLLVGNVVVLILGVTSSGIQAIRLEYFEFFEKFYEGDGREYSPLGAVRKYTAEE